MWDKDEIIQSLRNDYISHWRRKEHFERNDNDVDREYEIAVCDYIINKLATIEEKTLNEVAEEIDDILEGVFLFDPQDNPKYYPIKQGDKVCVVKDIYYNDYKSFVANEGEETAAELLDEDGIFVLDEYRDEVYIPAGTYMTYKGEDDNGWPTFEIHGEPFDFCGEAFKLKKV